MVGTGDMASGNEGYSINSCLLSPPSSQRGSEPHGLKKKKELTHPDTYPWAWTIELENNIIWKCFVER